MAKFDADRAAQAVALADFLGKDQQAAKECGIADRTIRAYRERANRDPHLAAKIREKRKLLDDAAKEWAPEAAHTLKVGVMKIRELISEATVKDLRAVVGAVKILGDLDFVREFLKDEQQPGADREGASTKETEGRPSGGPPSGAGGDSSGERRPPVH